MAEKTIDLQDLRCPLPIVALNREFRELSEGDTVTVLANDAAFKPDLEAWCRQTGNELIELMASGTATTARLRKGRQT